MRPIESYGTNVQKLREKRKKTIKTELRGILAKIMVILTKKPRIRKNEPFRRGILLSNQRRIFDRSTISKKKLLEKEDLVVSINVRTNLRRKFGQ